MQRIAAMTDLEAAARKIYASLTVTYMREDYHDREADIQTLTQALQAVREADAQVADRCANERAVQLQAMMDLEATAREIVVEVMGSVYVDTFVGVVLCDRIAKALAAVREADARRHDAIAEENARLKARLQAYEEGETHG
jgi:hypothetical protein